MRSARAPPASAAPIAGFLALGAEKARKEFGDQLIVGIASGSGKNQVDEPLAEIEEPPFIAHTLEAFEQARATRGG